jgi:hypothetical protein
MSLLQFHYFFYFSSSFLVAFNFYLTHLGQINSNTMLELKINILTLSAEKLLLQQMAAEKLLQAQKAAANTTYDPTIVVLTALGIGVIVFLIYVYFPRGGGGAGSSSFSNDLSNGVSDPVSVVPNLPFDTNIQIARLEAKLRWLNQSLKDTESLCNNINSTFRLDSKVLDSELIKSMDHVGSTIADIEHQLQILLMGIPESVGPVLESVVAVIN